MSDPVPASADQPASATAPRPAPIPLVLPPARFTSPSDAFKPYQLKCPVTVDGRDYAVIGIRRFTVDQIAAITDNYRANRAIDPDAKMQMPIYVDDQCQDLPKAVLGCLTPDEREDLDEETGDFLPRMLRPDITAPDGTAPKTDASTLADGSSIEPAS